MPNTNEEDDDIGKPIWKIPTDTEDADPDSEEINPDEIVPEPRPKQEENVIYAPSFDPEAQRKWEEEEERRRKDEEDREKRENPRGVWEMKGRPKRNK